jgi:hypothetical protein
MLEISQSENRRIQMFEKPEQENRWSMAISHKRHRITSFTEKTDSYIDDQNVKTEVLGFLTHVG